jgi:molybdenum cofactor guanylyltransferase
MAPVGAIVLCGGQSRRMGTAKAWLDFGSEKLLQRVVRLVGAVASPIVVVAAPGQPLPPLPETAIVVRDAVEGRGPLQGLSAGFSALPATVELAFATATDAPFLNPAWITRLAELLGNNDLAMPVVHGYHHPLAALYRVGSVRSAVERLLAEDRLRPVYLIETVATRLITADELRDVDPEFATLRNLNTPREYEQALKAADLPASTSRG